MRNAISWSAFLLTLLWVGLAFAQKNPGNATGISSPEPSMLLYAIAGAVPAWLLFRNK